MYWGKRISSKCSFSTTHVTSWLFRHRDLNVPISSFPSYKPPPSVEAFQIPLFKLRVAFVSVRALSVKIPLHGSLITLKIPFYRILCFLLQLLNKLIIVLLWKCWILRMEDKESQTYMEQPAMKSAWQGKISNPFVFVFKPQITSTVDSLKECFLTTHD